MRKGKEINELAANLNAGASKVRTIERQRFVRALAEYLVVSQVEQSIKLQSGEQSAKDWSKLRCATPLFGYPTVDEAYSQLCEFLGVPDADARKEKGR